jgi:hypothetical protein
MKDPRFNSPRWGEGTSPFLNIFRDEAGLVTLRKLILRLGRQRFGPHPTQKQREKLECMIDLDRMERIVDRLLSATSWSDLLATP